jgi:hypothetical protein
MIPCIPGRAHQSHQEIKDALIDKFNENKDALSRWPYPSCNGKEIQKIRSLGDYSTAENVKKVAANISVVYQVFVEV